MTTRSRLTVAFASAVLLVASPGSFATVDAPRPPAAGSEARAQGGKPVLEKGMTAETIIRLIGKPGDITPRPSPEGKAETWTYRRVVETKHLLDASSVETIPVFVRASPTEGNVMGTATRPIYNLKHVTVYQVTALLMFDGRLVVARQWQEQEQSYDN